MLRDIRLKKATGGTTALFSYSYRNHDFDPDPDFDPDLDLVISLDLVIGLDRSPLYRHESDYHYEHD
jgi:hypothetical protein